MDTAFPSVEAENKAMSSNCLPYGDTLHYTECSCPSSWIPGARACDAVDAYVQQAFTSLQQGLVTPVRKLRVLFCLPHHNITGGMKMLVEQIRLLRSRGHHVTAVMRSDTAERAMPPWTTIEADEDIVCRLTQRMDEVCDTQGVDVVLIGIFHQVAEWMLASSAPIVYWEQGHEWLFGDPVRLQEVHNYKRQDQLFHQVMHLPCAMAAVSEAVQKILSQEFGRSSLLIHNGIDCERFTPGLRSTLAPTLVLTASNYVEPSAPAAHHRPSVLLVGNPALPLKGFDVAIAVLSLVNRVLPIEVTWVCQTQPKEEQVPGLSSCGLKMNLHVSPSQDVLPSLYRGHDCFLFCSRYEAWGMPVLEAMASGVAVVTTNCLGVTSFAKPGVNCFMAGPQDLMGLMRGVVTILEKPVVRERLVSVGLRTAQLFSPDSVVGQLENVLYSLTACKTELLQMRQPAMTDIQLTALWAAHACARTQEQQQSLQQLQQQLQQHRHHQLLLLTTAAPQHHEQQEEAQDLAHVSSSFPSQHSALQLHTHQQLASPGHQPHYFPYPQRQQQQTTLASAGQQQQQFTVSLQRLQHQQFLAIAQQQQQQQQGSYHQPPAAQSPGKGGEAAPGASLHQQPGSTVEASVGGRAGQQGGPSREELQGASLQGGGAGEGAEFGEGEAGVRERELNGVEGRQGDGEQPEKGSGLAGVGDSGPHHQPQGGFSSGRGGQRTLPTFKQLSQQA